MGVTHLQSDSACLEEEERAQERVGGGEAIHFGVRKMEFHSKNSFLEYCALPFNLDVVLPPHRLSYFLKGIKPNILLMFRVELRYDHFHGKDMRQLSPGVL